MVDCVLQTPSRQGRRLTLTLRHAIEGKYDRIGLRCNQCASKRCAGIAPAFMVTSSVLICWRAKEVTLLRAFARSCETVHAQRQLSASRAIITILKRLLNTASVQNAATFR